MARVIELVKLIGTWFDRPHKIAIWFAGWCVLAAFNKCDAQLAQVAVDFFKWVFGFFAITGGAIKIAETMRGTNGGKQ